jgi:hypothetical protein
MRRRGYTEQKLKQVFDKRSEINPLKTYLNGELAALTATFKCQQIAYVSQTYQSCLGRVAHYIPGTILVGNGVMTAFSKDVYHFMWPKLVDG